MTATPQTPPPPPTHAAEKAITLALRLAHAENALQALTSGQADAIVDPDGKTHLLRPAQEHLRQNERRLQAVIESTADVITVVDRGGMILSQSRAVRRVLGYEPDELVGSSIFRLIREEDWPRFYSAFFNVIEGFDENATVQIRHRARDGSYRLIEATAGKLRDVSSASVVFSLRPITSPLRARTQPGVPGTPDICPAGEDREFMTLSHGRRIPPMAPVPGIVVSEPAPR